jgi:hypothetical protein
MIDKKKQLNKENKLKLEQIQLIRKISAGISKIADLEKQHIQRFK